MRQKMAISTILSLDLGTKFGWATYKDGEITSGNYDLSSKPKVGRFEGGGIKFLRFERELERLIISSGPIDLISFEAVHRHVQGAVAAAHAYGGFLAILTKFCEQRDIPYEGYGVKEVKKSFTGNGAAKKGLVIQKANEFGFNVTDDNEADAIAVLHHTMGLYNIER